MTRQSNLYDLTLLLSTSADEQQRAKILSDVEATISSGGGSLERNDNWGTRPMTYQILHQRNAEYHLLQFSAPPAVLESLSHSLRIADEVLRFRIIKVLPGTPPAPSSPPPVLAAAPGGVGPASTGPAAGESESGS